MATILTKKSDTASSVPSAAQLTNSATGAELAVNTADKRLYTKDSGGNVVEVGTNPSTFSLPNGTANAVPYLNGSKVLTTGSALTFDGASLRLANAVGTTANGLRLDGGAQAHYWYLSDNVTSVYEIGSGSGQWKWLNSNGEQMRLTSTGLGIGTSSPNAPLTFASATGRKVGFYQATQGYSIGVESSEFRFVTDSSAVFSWRNGSTYSTATEYMRLDSSGNLGLGVTPSDWQSATIRPIEINRIGNFVVGNGSAAAVYLGANTRFESDNWRYANNGAAGLYTVADNTHFWRTAPSGTAGDAISFTQAMTLDASGNLLVGTTTTSGNAGIQIRPNGNGTSRALISIDHVSGAPSGDFYASFNYAGGQIGSITQNGTTAVAYNTSSDYRLKNITGPVTNSGAYIDSLKPVQGTWKADGSTFVGLIAHEVQEVSRTQVATGEKDGEQMQAMDYSSSEIIANLIAEVQSLRKRLAAAGIA